MIPVMQIKENDCFRACMASILELPNNTNFPHIESETWYLDWNKLLSKFGMSLSHDQEKIWGDGFWIASVPSLNFKNKWHAIVMLNTKVAFDPSLKKRYKKGTNLLKGVDIIKEGYWLTISDISKIRELEKFRESLL